VDASKDGRPTHDGRRIVSKDALVNDFLEWHKARGKPVQNAAVRQAVGSLITEHCPPTWNANPVVRLKGDVTRHYWTLPPLDVFRKSFAKRRGVDAIESEPVQCDLKVVSREVGDQCF
jgi:hypothetical protein